MKKFLNLTPHELKLNDGTVIPASGTVARVSNSFTEFDEDGVCRVEYGDVEGLPAPEPDTLYIVSAMVLAATGRDDVVAPATGHPACVRQDGRIVSVPGFVR